MNVRPVQIVKQNGGLETFYCRKVRRRLLLGGLKLTDVRLPKWDKSREKAPPMLVAVIHEPRVIVHGPKTWFDILCDAPSWWDKRP